MQFITALGTFDACKIYAPSGFGNGAMNNQYAAPNSRAKY
jgi:hypothetical protein